MLPLGWVDLQIYDRVTSKVHRLETGEVARTIYPTGLLMQCVPRCRIVEAFSLGVVRLEYGKSDR